MKIYYYHTRPILQALDEWKQFRHPGHILYGLTHFQRNGITPVIHKFRMFASRKKLMLYNLVTILTCRESYDVLYGTSYRGLELIIFLRALGLYRKPIAIWHHQAVPQTRGFLKRQLSRLFYRGIDCLFFFSNALIDDSLQTGKVKKERMHLIHWGADLDFYDHVMQEVKGEKKYRFISTGKENRDFQTLLQSFEQTSLPLELFTSPSNGDKHYESILQRFSGVPNVHIHITHGIIPYQLAVEVAKAETVVISCLDYPYTVGLTTLVEALALSLPVISTRNPKYGIDIEGARAGLLVDYNDVEGWNNATRYLAEHPQEAAEMGRNGRKLAETTYNLEHFTCELSVELKHLVK